MAKTDKELLENYKRRIKEQNEAIKKNYDKITATLPKGTVKRIKALGMSINKVVNDSVLTFLEHAEKLQDPIQTTQEADISHEKETIEEVSKEPEKSLETTAITFNTTEELNDYVLKKQAENKARHEAEAQQVKQEEEIPGQSLNIDAEDAEIDRRLKQTLAYREQVKKEREIYGEFTPEIIHEFVAKMGADIKTSENKARIVEKFGQINYDSLIAYMDSKKI